MLEGLDHTLLAEMARLVELDPDLSLRDAANRVLYLAGEEGVHGLAERVERLSGNLIRHAVLNPIWLAENGLHQHFFLCNGRAGFLDEVVRAAMETNHVGVSQYLLYGDWDSLITLYGSDREADTLYSSLRAGTDEPPVRFSADEALVAYRHSVQPPLASPIKIDIEAINALAADYDDPALARARDQYLATGHILGPTWTASGESPYPVVAYIGIFIRGRSSITPMEICAGVLRNEVLSQTLVHLYRVAQGIPFHYFAKLACRNMHELDMATNALGFMRLGDIRFDVRTLVVAAETGRFPIFRPPNVSGLAVGPDFEGIMRTATIVYESLGVEERRAFNALDDHMQVAVVRVVAELQQKARAAGWERDTERRIHSALATFTRECVSPADRGNFTGAVAEMATTTERLARRLIYRLAYAAYGGNPAQQMQRVLRLPASNFRNPTLGKVVQALHIASSQQNFAPYAEILSDRWLDRLESFTESRNRWAHDEIDLHGLELLDEAHRVLIEALGLVAWLSNSIASIPEQPAERQGEGVSSPDELTISERNGRGLSVFVSHASQDARIARRVAMGLRAVGYNTWFDELELSPGDSLVERINDAIATTDVLLVLLSQHSVRSRWVRRELATGIARELSAGGVTVIPVLLEDCEIPGLLAGTIYVDLRVGFELGFQQLSDALRRATGTDDSADT